MAFGIKIRRLFAINQNKFCKFAVHFRYEYLTKEPLTCGRASGLGALYYVYSLFNIKKLVMAESTEKKLFTEFPAVTTAQWEEVISADLKGADYEKKLVWKTSEGFSLRPYYRGEDLAGIKHLGSAPGEFPYVRGTKKDNQWLVRQTIVVKTPETANAEALKVLMCGVDSLCFKINGSELTAAQLDALLAGIDVKAIEVNFTGCATAKVASLFVDKMIAEGIDPKAVRASFDIDPIIKKLSLKGKSCDGSAMAEVVALVKKAADYTRLRFITVGGDVFSSCAASSVQELAFSLAVGHEYMVALMEAGLSADEAARTIKFNMAVGPNYFIEIAKVRAARMLWANIVTKYDTKNECSAKMRICAKTAMWNSTVYDPYVNMLRGTTEAMSASIAGVSSIEVMPFNAAYESATEFSNRIARNVQLLLKEESHIDQVTDVAGGSYYIETLTQNVAEHAWALFNKVEELGGYAAAFAAGFPQEQLEASAAKRDKNIATRREILLGTNQYPNFTEVAVDAVTEATVTPATAGCCCTDVDSSANVLKPYRGAMPFESLRLATDRSGREVKVFMLTVGNLTFARARSQFACNFFACAGFRVMDNTFFSSVEEGVAAAKEAGADIVVVCSSDDLYLELVPQVAAAMEGAITVVAGAPACQGELESQGINHFISVKSNVLETLKGYQKELGI